VCIDFRLFIVFLSSGNLLLSYTEPRTLGLAPTFFILNISGLIPALVSSGEMGGTKTVCQGMESTTETSCMIILYQKMDSAQESAERLRQSLRKLERMYIKLRSCNKSLIAVLSSHSVCNLQEILNVYVMSAAPVSKIILGYDRPWFKSGAYVSTAAPAVREIRNCMKLHRNRQQPP
jgi:hypothetical protein